MSKKELMDILETLPDRAEVLIDIGERYAEVKDIKLEYSQRVDKRVPFVIVNIYR